MAETALEKTKGELEKMKERARAVRARAEKSAKTVQRDATSVAAAYLYGSMKKERRRTNTAMPTVGGLEPEVAATLVLYAGSHFADGMLAEVAHDAAVGVACGYAFTKSQE